MEGGVSQGDLAGTGRGWVEGGGKGKPSILWGSFLAAMGKPKKVWDVGSWARISLDLVLLISSPVAHLKKVFSA